MFTNDADVQFERVSGVEPHATTLIEGLPGFGLVAAIAVELITRQLSLERHGTIRSEEFPPVASFVDGRVRDLVRVYAGENPDLMTLQSDVVLPPTSYQALSQCVLGDLAEVYERAIFLAGAPAQSPEQVGDVVGIATTEALRDDLREAGVDPAEGSGVIGGITGALVSGCHKADIPAVGLIVRANPFIPDPGAAREVIDTALEPMVDFDVDTAELSEQAEEIEHRLAQIASQFEQAVQSGEMGQQPATRGPSMYQ